MRDNYLDFKKYLRKFCDIMLNVIFSTGTCSIRPHISEIHDIKHGKNDRSKWNFKPGSRKKWTLPVDLTLINLFKNAYEIERWNIGKSNYQLS